MLLLLSYCMQNIVTGKGSKCSLGGEAQTSAATEAMSRLSVQFLVLWQSLT